MVTDTLASEKIKTTYDQELTPRSVIADDTRNVNALKICGLQYYPLFFPECAGEAFPLLLAELNTSLSIDDPRLWQNRRLLGKKRKGEDLELARCGVRLDTCS